jgi:endonuclease III
VCARRSTAGRRRKEEHRISEILVRLDETYPDVTCALLHQNPYQLLVATVLSAQCTDVRVNMVTPLLFKHYPTPEAMALAREEELQEIIRSTGFFRNKARNLVRAAETMMEKFDGAVPEKMEDLLQLPGVARKTANVIMGTAFGISSGVVVDTHVRRLSRRLDLTSHNDPVKIEKDLMEKIPEDHWIDFSHQLIHHGRQICKAQKPRCEQCVLADLCPYFQES